MIFHSKNIQKVFLPYDIFGGFSFPALFWKACHTANIDEFLSLSESFHESYGYQHKKKDLGHMEQ